MLMGFGAKPTAFVGEDWQRDDMVLKMRKCHKLAKFGVSHSKVRLCLVCLVIVNLILSVMVLMCDRAKDHTWLKSMLRIEYYLLLV